jgi:hypothetical protein
MPEPPDYELKLGRAHKHLIDLEAGVTEWIQGTHHSVRNDRDPNDPTRLVYYATAERPPKDPFSILIGDTLHGLRSGLDLLAFNLAAAYTKPLPDAMAETSEFPIFGNEDRKGRTGVGAQMFRDNGRFKVRGIDPRALVVIEKVQPYHAADYHADPLWRLNELDRINKHRLLHVAIAHGAGFLLDTRKSSNYVLGPGLIESLAGPITTDTPIARVPVRTANYNAPMHLEIQPALEVAFGQGTPEVEYEAVMPVLIAIYNRVVVDVVPPLAAFL